jgi:hypothetical protein
LLLMDLLKHPKEKRLIIRLFSKLMDISIDIIELYQFGCELLWDWKAVFLMEVLDDFMVVVSVGVNNGIFSAPFCAIFI